MKPFLLNDSSLSFVQLRSHQAFQMKNLAVGIFVLVSVGLTTAVSVNKLLGDEWNLFKVGYCVTG